MMNNEEIRKHIYRSNAFGFCNERIYSDLGKYYPTHVEELSEHVRLMERKKADAKVLYIHPKDWTNLSAWVDGNQPLENTENCRNLSYFKNYIVVSGDFSVYYSNYNGIILGLVWNSRNPEIRENFKNEKTKKAYLTFQIMNSFLGYFIMDSKSCIKIPNSFFTNHYYASDKSQESNFSSFLYGLKFERRIFLDMFKVSSETWTKQIRNGSILKVIGINSNSTLNLKKLFARTYAHAKDIDIKKRLIDTAVRVILKLEKTTSTVFYSESATTNTPHTHTISGIVNRDDSFIIVSNNMWSTEISVDREIPVRSHIRNQFCGKDAFGNNLHKEIVIPAHCREGYHRKSKRDSD